ncbi:hypothetical protein QMK33_03725 [Hymenobacter sp. H14-R3]|uniref:hypothetical protein n=1 Tax=Hymenobacter sp. H14-R3 TaxID=3046308 RepID=UPI0024BA45D5|nr:hypothetical protein [Hymenobacter sp. H14-R3]MDJ0364246.1 hypothetical protein [Hymenobacter sp. H14-R3]
MQPITITLPQPCAASWDAMTPNADGRHCTACQKTVVDFTGYTDAGLAAYLGQHGQLPCGRFRASQLGRVLLPAAVPVAGWRRWLGAVAALLGVGSLTIPAQAQHRPVPSHPVQAETSQPLERPAPPRLRTRPAVRPVWPIQPVRPMPMLHEAVLGGAPIATPQPPQAPPKK